MVRAKDRKIIIGPRVALEFRRDNLLPHPVQVEVPETIRRFIEKALEDAADIVINHYHGANMSLVDANPYQLPVKRVAEFHLRPGLWAKGTKDISYNQAHRAKALASGLGQISPVAEGMGNRPLTFSTPIYHGERDGHGGGVMTRSLIGQIRWHSLE